MSILSGNVIFDDDSKNYLSSGDIYGSGFFYGCSMNANSIGCAYFFDQSVNSGNLLQATFSGNSINSGVVLSDAIFRGNSQNKGIVRGRGIFHQLSSNRGFLSQATFNDNSSNCGNVSGNACFGSGAINSGIVGGQTCYITNAKHWTRTSSYLPMNSLISRTLPNKFAVNHSGNKIVINKDNSNFAVYSLSENIVSGYKQWNQIGSNILNYGQFTAINAVGDRVAIANALDMGRGTVTVYDFVGNNWQQFQQKMTHSHSTNPIMSVSLNSVGDRIAIGVPNSVGYNASVENGAVEILCWSNEFNEWDGVGYSLIFGQDGEKIGKSIKLNHSGDRVVFTTQSGFKVYQAQSVPRPNTEVIDTCWYQMGSTIYLPNASQYSLTDPGILGSVSMNGDGSKILVSQSRQLPSIYNTSGVVAAYCWSGNSWNQMGNMLSSQQQDDYFGLDLEMNSLGDKIIIGSNNSPSGYFSSAKGRALIYDWNGSNWNKNNYDLGNDDLTMPETYYGQQVSMAACGNVVYASKQISDVTSVSQYQILN